MILRILVVAGLLAASVSVEAQPREENPENLIPLNKRVFPLVNVKGQTLGTAFRICKPNVVLTAAHVVHNRSLTAVFILDLSSQATSFAPTRIEKHPEADVAALFLNETDTANLGCFNLGVPPSEQKGLYLLAEEILSYGYPVAQRPLRQRLMKGHIQSHFQAEGNEYADYRYAAYELSFPSFGGMSGSPVFLHHERNSVISIVTANLRYKDKYRGTRADWAISVALPPLAEWLNGLAGTLSTP